MIINVVFTIGIHNCIYLSAYTIKPVYIECPLKDFFVSQEIT